MKKYYFQTKDLVTIAVLACLGSVMSTYLGYIGHMIGSTTGIPYASQVLTGLHVFWVVLVLSVVNKKGAGILGAVLNNFLQFLMGSHLGIWVLPVGLLQGLLVEAGYWPLKRINRTLALSLAGGLGSTSHILVMQILIFQIPSMTIVASLAGISFLSGVVWGGLFTMSVIGVLEKTGVVKRHAGSLPATDVSVAAK